MKWKTALLLGVLCLVVLSGFTGEGTAYYLMDDTSGSNQIYGVKEQKVGHGIVKKRLVSASSMQESIDKDEDFELALEQYPKVKVVATGYYAGYESTGKNPSDPSYGITFSGVKVRRDEYSTIAADLRVFPLGTILYIPGYGYGVVADKGGAIRGKKIDLYFETKEDVFKFWGKKTVDVYVVQKGPFKVTETLMQALNEKGVAAMAQAVN